MVAAEANSSRALYSAAIGMRPSPGAAFYTIRLAAEYASIHAGSEVAAAGDGRTPVFRQPARNSPLASRGKLV